MQQIKYRPNNIAINDEVNIRFISMTPGRLLRKLRGRALITSRLHILPRLTSGLHLQRHMTSGLLTSQKSGLHLPPYMTSGLYIQPHLASGLRIFIASDIRSSLHIPLLLTSGLHLPLILTSGLHIPLTLTSGLHIPLILISGLHLLLQVPLPVDAILAKDHPVKVGLSDAYYFDSTTLFGKVKLHDL